MREKREKREIAGNSGIVKGKLEDGGEEIE